MPKKESNNTNLNYVNLLQREDSWSKRITDVLLSIVLEIMVIFCWHGIWTLEDTLSDYYGIDMTQSGWFSLSAGIPSTFLVFVVQFHVARRVSIINDDKSKSWQKTCAKHSLGFLFNLMALFSTVNTFRGYWYLYDEYLIPSKKPIIFSPEIFSKSIFIGDYELSLINGQIYGAVLLFLLYSGSSLHAGVFRDVGDENGSSMVEFYFSSYFFIKVVTIFSKAFFLWIMFFSGCRGQIRRQYLN